MNSTNSTDAKEVVLPFWETMRSNDFYAAAELLSEDYIGFWPQSAGQTRGRDNFAKINSAYPVTGRWMFELNHIVCEKNEVVTDVSITDGDIQARVISFSTVHDGLVEKQFEFWPDPMPVAEWRRHWIQRL